MLTPTSNAPSLVGTPVIFDVSEPLAPVPVGALADDGYTHDSLCRTYKGPDKAHKGNEICFNFNEDSVTIYDVTANPQQPVLLREDHFCVGSSVDAGAAIRVKSRPRYVSRGGFKLEKALSVFGVDPSGARVQLLAPPAPRKTTRYR